MTKTRSVAWVACSLVALAVAATGVRADAPLGLRQPPEERPRSIHELETITHRAQAADSSQTRRPSTGEPHLRSTATLTREVHGYHPWWMGTSYESYDWSLLSTVAFFSLELDGTGAIVDDHGWPWTTLVTTAHAHGVRVIAAATLFSTSAIDALLSDPARRQVAVTNLVLAVQSAGADGVSLDFEGVPGSRKQDLVTFVGELRSALASALAEPYLSVATPAVDWSDAFDYDELAARCDHLMVMAYDYHWSGSTVAGPVAPLGGWGTYDVPWTVQDYQSWGTTPDQMLLGVPYYGYRWVTVSGSPGALTDSVGVARTFSQASAAAEAHGPQWDAPSSTPWVRWQDPDWNQLWFDDGTSLRAKYDLVLEEGLAGVGIWALGYDGTRPELWAALAESFSTASGVPQVAIVPEATLRVAGRNPFRDHIELAFSLPRPGPMRLTVYDVGGRQVRTLASGAVPAGAGRATWAATGPGGRDVAAGIYYVRLETGDASRTLQVVRLR